MLTLNKIQVTNFKSLVGNHTFDFFGGQSGLYYITGKNQVEPMLGANGCGKTTLLDAITWTLYGKTTRGLRAANVHSWTAKTKTTAATIHVTVNNIPATIYRSWTPNKLVLQIADEDGKDVVQEVIDDFLRKTEIEFRNSVIIGQFATTFFDLPPSTKMGVLTDVLGLDQWLDLSADAAALVTDIEGDIREAEVILAKHQGSYDTLSRNIADLVKRQGEYTKELWGKTKVFRERVEAAKKQRTLAKAALTKAKSTYDYSIRSVEDATADYEEVSDVVGTYKDQLHEKELELQGVLTQLKVHGDRSQKIQSLASTCPVCEQTVDKKHKSKIQMDIAKDISQLTAKRKVIGDAIDTINGILHTAQQRVATVKDHYSNALRTKDIREREVAKTTQELARLETVITTNEERIKECNDASANPYTPQIEQAKVRLTALSRRVKAQQGEIAKMESALPVYKFWVKGFKEVRLYVVKNALTQFEVLVNNCLQELGLAGWEITFDIERATKAGGVSKGFSVMVKSPTSAGTVPWEAWSGGEGQRLRLAGALGLADLVQNHSGGICSLLALDEPTQHLGAEGIDDLVTLLGDLARKADKQIWLIDHRTMNGGLFTDTLTITKTGSGSHLS